MRTRRSGAVERRGGNRIDRDGKERRVYQWEKGGNDNGKIRLCPFDPKGRRGTSVFALRTGLPG